jgi:hypothetical protein
MWFVFADMMYLCHECCAAKKKPAQQSCASLGIFSRWDLSALRLSPVAPLSISRDQFGMYRARWLSSQSRQVVNHFCNLGGSLGSTVEKRKLPSLFFFHTLNGKSRSIKASIVDLLVFLLVLQNQQSRKPL